MIHSGKHAEERGDSHYNVEVSHYKHGIMQVNINSRVAKEDTRQTAGDK